MMCRYFFDLLYLKVIQFNLAQCNECKVFFFSSHCVFVCPRVHELEEQVKDAETRADQSLDEEMKRHREAYSKMERERNTQIDQLSKK